MDTMEKPAVDAKRDSDSGRDPSDEEKRAGITGDIAAQDGLPPDPDAHLSPEERAKIVSSLHHLLPHANIPNSHTNIFRYRIESSFGSSISRSSPGCVCSTSRGKLQPLAGCDYIINRIPAS